MPKSAPLSTSVTLSTWPAGTAKSTKLETSVPTAPTGAPASSLIAVRTGLRLASRTGAVFAATAFWANSDVSVKVVNVALLLVAVALIKLPAETVAVNVVLKLALPLPSVVTLTKPRYVWPSPWPVPSWAVLLKNSMRNWLLAVLFNEPTMVTWVLDTTWAEVSTGKFCRLLAPVSPSPASLAVTPFAPRSIPSRPLLAIEFCVRWMPVLLPPMAMPEPLQPVMVLLSTVTPVELLAIHTPPSMPRVPSLVIVLFETTLVPLTVSSSTPAACRR